MNSDHGGPCTLRAASSFDVTALAHKAGEFRMLLKYGLEYSGCQRVTAFQASPMREPRPHSLNAHIDENPPEKHSARI